MPAASQKGFVVTPNNRTGINWIAVTLSGTTPQVWTHNIGVGPARVQVFTQDGAPVEKDVCAVACSTTAITLTPAAGGTFNVFVEWNIDPTRQNGTPSTNFV